jgi:hypothetical protein
MRGAGGWAVTTVNQFAKEGYVLGIDSYGWNGATLPDSASEAKFVYILNNDPFNGHWTEKYRDAQINAAISQGRHVGVFSIWRSTPDAQKQANDFLNSVEPIKASLSLPLVMDIEDKYAPKTLQTVTKLKSYVSYMQNGTTGLLWAYTANWWADSWLRPFPAADLSALYNLGLWVCDPPPDDTHLPGKWTDTVMKQSYIDIPGVEGMNASVDIDHMKQSVWDAIFAHKPAEHKNPYLRKLLEGRPLA